MSAEVVSSANPLSTSSAEERIVRYVVIALNKGQISEAVAQFARQFTFADYALGLQFTQKEHLFEFFQKSRELQPDFLTKVVSIFQVEGTITAEWELTAIQDESIGYFRRRHPICVQGVTVVQVINGKITRWSDYYDEALSQRGKLVALFEDWVES